MGLPTSGENTRIEVPARVLDECKASTERAGPSRGMRQVERCRAEWEKREGSGPQARRGEGMARVESKSKSAQRADEASLHPKCSWSGRAAVQAQGRALCMYLWGCVVHAAEVCGRGRNGEGKSARRQCGCVSREKNETSARLCRDNGSSLVRVYVGMNGERRMGQR